MLRGTRTVRIDEDSQLKVIRVTGGAKQPADKQGGLIPCDT